MPPKHQIIQVCYTQMSHWLSSLVLRPRSSAQFVSLADFLYMPETKTRIKGTTGNGTI
jgi:hypothetical protein